MHAEASANTEPFQCRNGTNVDDPPLATLDHLRRDRFGTEKGSGQIDVDNLAPFRLAHLKRRLTGVYARAVDQDVDPAEGCQRSLHHPPYVGRLGHIGRHSFHPPDPVTRDSRGDRSRLVGMPADQHEIGPCSGKRVGHRHAQTLAAAGYQGYAPFQAKHPQPAW